MKHIGHLDHPTLFELHPLDAEPPVAQRKITPGCLLPVPQRELIDSKRACSILGVTEHVLTRLIRENRIAGAYRLSDTSRFHWKIPYESIVAYCDWLRMEFHIRDRRPKRPAGARWRDADLLPFPLVDTVTMEDAMRGLGGEDRRTVVHLIEEGRFEAYRLMPDVSASHWRISKSSLFAYRDEMRLRATARKASFRPGR